MNVFIFSRTKCIHQILCQSTFVQWYEQHHCQHDTTIPINMVEDQNQTNSLDQTLFQRSLVCFLYSSLQIQRRKIYVNMHNSNILITCIILTNQKIRRMLTINNFLCCFAECICTCKIHCSHTELISCLFH